MGAQPDAKGLRGICSSGNSTTRLDNAQAWQGLKRRQRGSRSSGQLTTIDRYAQGGQGVESGRSNLGHFVDGLGEHGAGALDLMTWILSRTWGVAAAPALYATDSGMWRDSRAGWRSASARRTRGAGQPVAACGTR
jgi:hypothetical protein